MWEKSNSDPPAYTSEDRKWGLVRMDSGWILHFLSSGRSIREVYSFDSEDPPLDRASDKVNEINNKRKGASWKEVSIRGRPGEEGPLGGRPIPMQTQDKRRKK